MNHVLKRTLTGLAVGAVVIAAILLIPPVWFAPVIGVLALLAICEYAQLLHRKLSLMSFTGGLALLVGAILIGAGLMSLAGIAMYGNLMLLYVVAVVKFSDVGGFACGLSSAKLMKAGNHKLCPTISPNKSWEGLMGSLVFSTVVSLLFSPFVGFGFSKAIGFALIAALIGTAGDLVESKFKRWVGVKDSSTMRFTNGMGGILDMLDSLLIAPAIMLALI